MRWRWGTAPLPLCVAICVVAAAGCRVTVAPVGGKQDVATGVPVSESLASVSASPGLQVVATFSILGDLVRNVAGMSTVVDVLVGPDGDVHAFEPNPADGVVLADADIIFENGLHLEPWLDDLYGSSASAARRVVVTDGVTPFEVSTDEIDPHVWQDVTAAAQIVEVIAAAMAKTDPENAAVYLENAAAYNAKLAGLDQQIQAAALLLDPGRRKLVTSHDALGYFARRYGFDIVATALGSSTESADPSAGDIARLVDTIRSAGMPAIFAENVAHSDLMQRIAQETGATLVDTLYTDALGAPGTAGDTYIGMMSYNSSQIVGALTR